MENCPICLQPCEDAGEHVSVQLKCGHVIGRSCGKVWIRVNPACPFCRAPIAGADVYEPGTVPDRLPDEECAVINRGYETMGDASAVIERTARFVKRLKLAVKPRESMGERCLKMRRDCTVEAVEITRVIVELWGRLATAMSSSFIFVHTDDGVTDFAVMRSRLCETMDRLRAVQSEMRRWHRQLIVANMRNESTAVKRVRAN